jgi:hypothetical protein
MRGTLSLIIQGATVFLSVSLMSLSVYLLTEASEPKVYISSLKMASFSDIHAEPRYDPETGNDLFCKLGNTFVQNMSAI